MTSLLSVQNVTMKFGGLIALNDVSFTVEDRQITAVIGPNGAGKTTLFNCLTGFYKPTQGRLHLHHQGHSFHLEAMPTFQVVRQARVARTFQNIRLFPGMSVLENLLVAQHTALMRASFFSLAGLFRLPSYRHAERQAIDKASYWLDKMGLTFAADSFAGNLPYGLQRRLEIARAMCTDPRLLCLDEPAAGLNPRESADLGTILRMIRDEFKTAILLIEHDMSVVMELSDHVVVLDYGRNIAAGKPDMVRRDPSVLRAYLGGDLSHVES